MPKFTLDELCQFLYSNDWISAKVLAAHFSVSEKTIRNAIKQIEVLKVATIVRSNLGFKCIDYHKQDNTQSTSKHDPSLTNIIRFLCKQSSFVMMDELEETFYVSSSTMQSRLKNIEQWLEPFDASIIRKSNQVLLRANEDIKRKIMMTLFLNETDNHTITIETIESLFNKPVKHLYEFIIELLEENNIYLHDFALTNVLVHIIISIDRMEDNQFLNALKFDAPIEDLLQLGNKIGVFIKKTYGVALNKTEENYISMLIGSRGNIDQNQEKLYATLDKEIWELITLIKQQVYDEFLIEVNDPTFLYRFAIHIDNLIKRIKQNSSVRNPLLSMMKSQYPLIYDLSIFISSLIEKTISLSINEDEIAYIAFHIAAFIQPETSIQKIERTLILCPDYHQWRKRIKEVLQIEFSQYFKEIEFESPLMFNQDFSMYDLIISTERNLKSSNNVVHITPMVNAVDKQTIYDAIVSRSTSTIFRSHNNELLNLFNPKLFLYHPNFDNQEQLLIHMCKLLYQQDYVDQGFVDRVFEREKYSSTAFNNQVAVPHSLKMDAKKSAIAVALLKNSIQWKESRVKLVVLLAINKEERKLFMNTFDLFIETISEVNHVKLLLQSNDYHHFIKMLSTLMSRN